MRKDLKRMLLLPAFIAGFIIMGLASGYLTFKLLSFSKSVEVPDLHARTLFEANTALNKMGLHLKIDGEDYDPVIPSGSVIRQDIPPANKVKEGRGIGVVLSRGAKTFLVPDLVGQKIWDAEAAVNKGSVKIQKIIRVHSPSVEKDLIIAQRPNADETQLQQDGLTIVVSSGYYDTIYNCPDFTGKTRDEAKNIAEKLGLILEFAGPGEWVKSQKPKADSIIKSGDIIFIQTGGDTTPHG